MLRVCRKQCILLSIICLVAIFLGLTLFQTDSENLNDIKQRLNLPVQDKIKENVFHRKYSWVKRFTHGRNVTVTTPRTKALVKIDEEILKMIRDIHNKMVAVNVSVKPFKISCTEKSIDGTEDLLCMDPPSFLQHHKNPCWQSKNGFQCLPYFQVIGMDKCGSTDLFDRIAKHPDVLKNNGTLGKETMWWSWLRYGHWLRRRKKKLPFHDYINYFYDAANIIRQNPQRQYITGDGTPMDLWDNSGWRSIPQNNGLKEPKFITPHLIKHVNPKAKFLVILRDPTERLFSDYIFLKLGRMTTEAFHQYVIRAIKLLHYCTRRSSLRACLYNRNLHIRLLARIHLGFYVIFLQDWFQVFPKEQFLIIRTEDYASSTAEHLQEAFEFLNLRDLPGNVMTAISNSKRKYATKRKKNVGEMKEATRRILQELYGVFNKQLAVLLNDRRFSWQT